jgi:4'-phosphopantetheinyl transferase
VVESVDYEDVGEVALVAKKSIHVWVANEERVRRADVETLQTILHDSERERAARYRRPEDRLRSTVARGLARRALTHFDARTEPDNWAIVTEPHGRPVVEGGPWFSVTHTPGLVAVAVGAVAVGIDAEDLTRSTDVDAIAKRWLHPRERAVLQGIGDEERRRRFFEIWTLKEAYSKALGLGLKLGLKTFRVELSTPIRVHTEEGLLEGWSFRSCSQTERHCLSLAVEAPSVKVEWHDWP